MYTTRLAILCAVTLCLAGCRKHTSLFLPARPEVSTNQFSYSADNYTADVNTYNADIPGCNGATPCNPNSALAKQARNSIAWGLMGAIDDVYGVYTSRLATGKGAIAVTGDTATLGLTAAASIAHLAATKTIFAALATGIAGVNLSIDKNYFAQQTYQVLALAMETRRDTIRHQITDGLTSNITDYPLSAVKRDLVAYLYAGSLPGGLIEIQKEAGAASKPTQGKQAGGNKSTLTASPTSLGFGNQAQGTTSTQQLTLTNTGSSAINITASLVPSGGDFDVQNGTCGAAGTPLADKATCTISVVFHPTSAGPKTTSVEISDGGGGSPILTVAVTGTGT